MTQRPATRPKFQLLDNNRKKEKAETYLSNIQYFTLEQNQE